MIEAKKRHVLDTNLIVSGDNDLLTLHPFQSLRILNPRTFLDQKVEN